MFRKRIELPYEYRGVTIIDEDCNIEVAGRRWEPCCDEHDGEGWKRHIEGNYWEESWGSDDYEHKELWPSDIRRIVNDLHDGLEPPEVAFQRHLNTGMALMLYDVERIVDAGLTERGEWHEREKGLFGHMPSFPDGDWQ
ncbi:MAG: hypothetical protein ABFE08_09900 [Armatimonadia bacterium]